MKILFVIAEYFPDGAGSGRSVRNLAESLAAKGHEVSVARLTPEKRSFEETINGVKIYIRPIQNLHWVTDNIRNPLQRFAWHIIDSFNPRAMRDLDTILQIEKPDIVNTNVIAGFSPAIFKTIKRHNIPLVHTLRDYYLLCPKSSMFKNEKSCANICASCKPFAVSRKAFAKYADLFLANSEYVLKRHEDAGLFQPHHRKAVQFNMNDDDNIAKPRALDKNKTIRIGFIGRIDRVKGLEILLQATKHLQTENWHLKIAGTGDDDFIQTLKKKYPDPRIEFLGFTNADNFYGAIDILICPSLYGEPLPRVVYEAYRAALPVIAAKTGGTPEIIDHGKTGFLYEATDAKSLANHIDSLANDLDQYKLISANAAQKAKDFTPQKITQEFEAHLKSLMKEAS